MLDAFELLAAGMTGSAASMGSFSTLLHADALVIEAVSRLSFQSMNAIEGCGRCCGRFR